MLARRLLGNLPYQPGASLPASLGGYPTRLLLTAATNPESRLRLIDRLPADRRTSLRERSLGTDSVEGCFAEIHGVLGYLPDAATLEGRMANLAWLAQVRAMPEDQRGFALGGRSRIYECAAGDTAASAAAWNDGSALSGSGYAADAYLHAVAQRFKGKFASSRTLVTRDVHKRMRQ